MAIEQLVSPEISDELAVSSPALLNTEERFSFNQAQTIIDSGEGYYIPIDAWNRPLSPMETGTDVALPIISANNCKRRPSVHHAYFYERHYLHHSEPIRAVRHSRLQQTYDPSAHKMYHNHYKGTLMPDGEAAIARAIVLNSSGYVPHMGVIVKGDNTTIRELTDQERNRLRGPNVFILEKSKGDQARIGRFLMDYALRQGFSHIKQAHIEEFIELTPRKVARNDRLRDRKLRLGLRLTNIAISRAVDPVEPDYRAARREYALRKGSPKTAWERVKQLLHNRELDYLPVLEDRLVDEYYAFA